MAEGSQSDSAADGRASQNQRCACRLPGERTTLPRRGSNRALSEIQAAMKPHHAATVGPIMTVAEIAQYLKVHPSTLYRLIRRHQIPAFKIGSDYRFDKDSIKKWMTDRQMKV
jgi:excisionase family DNA binding protein